MAWVRAISHVILFFFSFFNLWLLFFSFRDSFLRATLCFSLGIIQTLFLFQFNALFITTGIIFIPIRHSSLFAHKRCMTIIILKLLVEPHCYKIKNQTPKKQLLKTQVLKCNFVKPIGYCVFYTYNPILLGFFKNNTC